MYIIDNYNIDYSIIYLFYDRGLSNTYLYKQILLEINDYDIDFIINGIFFLLISYEFKFDFFTNLVLFFYYKDDVNKCYIKILLDILNDIKKDINIKVDKIYF